MIERYIYTALESGLTLFKQRPAMFDALFSQLYGLGEREVTAIKKRFAAGFPRMEHAYSPVAATMPCYTLVTGSESQVQSMLANTAGVYAPVGNVGTPQPLFTNIWRHQITVLCYAQQRDMAGYMYEVAKCCLCLQLNYLIRQNINNVQLSGGDVALDEREPDRMFYRSLSLSAEREFRFFAQDGLTRLYSVDGLYIDDDGDGKAGGGVRATLTTTTSATPS